MNSPSDFLPLPSNMRITPTHSCFDDSFEFLASIQRALLREIEHEIRIVHALVQTSLGVFTHAWVEGQASCFFTLSPQGGPSEQIIWQSGFAELEGETRRVFYCIAAAPFYKHVVNRTRYPIPLALELASHGTSGPWRREYLKHVAQGNRRREMGVISHQKILAVMERVPVRSAQ